MKWTHRPTRPGSPGTHSTDRAVACDDVVVGSIQQVKGGPRDGQWDWVGLWRHASGSTQSLDESLAALREAAIQEMNRNPDLLKDIQEHHDRAKAGLNAWLAARGRHSEIK